jgi:hypothetical protein
MNDLTAVSVSRLGGYIDVSGGTDTLAVYPRAANAVRIGVERQ